MIKTKKLLLLIINLILFILFVNIVYSVDVGIIAEFEDGTVKTDCVNVDENTDGFAILEKSVFDVLWSPSSLLRTKLRDIAGGQQKGPWVLLRPAPLSSEQIKYAFLS